MNLIYKLYSKLNKNKLIGNTIEFLLNTLYFPIKLCLRSKKKLLNKEKKYYISICAIFKNEGHYLKEWVEYHKLIGIDHIYLYNNFSEDNYLEILTPYIEEEFVTLTDWPHKYSQTKAYQDCFVKYRNETFWLAFIDLDEFICPKYKYNVKEWIKDFEGFPAVVMYWQMFGTCGIMKADYTKLVIERFTTSWEKQDGTGKYILCTDKMFIPKNIYCHHIYLRYKILGIKIILPMINEKKKFVFFPMLYNSPSKSTIQLNHYFSKSYEEFFNKVNKGDVAKQTNEESRKREDFFKNHEIFNTNDNKVIFRYLTLLKKQINRE